MSDHVDKDGEDNTNDCTDKDGEDNTTDKTATETMDALE